MSIKYKLLCVLLGIGAAAVITTGFFGYEAGKARLTQTAMNQLTGIRRSKAHQIEAYFRNIRSQVRTLRESRMVIDAFASFAPSQENLMDQPPSPEIRASIAAYYKT